MMRNILKYLVIAAAVISLAACGGDSGRHNALLRQPGMFFSSLRLSINVAGPA